MNLPRTAADEAAESAPLTSLVTLRLATPTALRNGLALLGLRWSAQSDDHDEAGTEVGLYCWVAAGFGQELVNPMQGAALYIGIGTGLRGWRGRLRKERSWIGEDSDHGHGMAMHRTGAKVVGGPVTYSPLPVDWLPHAGVEEGDRAIHRLVSDAASTQPVVLAEAIAIRLAIHLGDTGAPVNSAGAGAWATNNPADWAAFACAKALCAGEGAHEPPVPAMRDRRDGALVRDDSGAGR
ncbi:hypothetical protein [Micromonospora sp. NPDC047187]|uniref:hypothetical protein n=1 Tax=Micromonospora sp. NPDC047187 TaxID=3155262 RepID=UPI0033DD9D96